MFSDNFPRPDTQTVTPRDRRFLALLPLLWMLGFGYLICSEVGKFGEMQKPMTRETTDFYSSDRGSYSSTAYSGGFVPGARGLAYAALVTLGLAGFLAAIGVGPNAWRMISSVVTFAWYSFGLGIYWWYRRMAPAPEVWPLGVVAAYGFVGLLPLGFAQPKGQSRSVLLWSGLGALVGAGAGAALGAAFYAVAQSLDFASSDSYYNWTVRLGWWPFGLGIGAAAGALLAAALASRRLGPPKPELGREKPAPGPTRATTANKPVAMVAGCVFALAGLVFLLLALTQFGEMQNPVTSSYVPSSATSKGGTSYSGGFMPGVGAFFAMLFFTVGVGVASLGAGPSPATGRVIALVLALLWHGVGIGSCWSYCSLAPKPGQWPFALVVVYEWLGLIPLALAVPQEILAGRLRSVVWYLMGGAFLGAAAGLLIGGVSGGIQLFLSSRHGGGTVGGTWWLYGFVGGATVVGVGFAVLRLFGWEMPSGQRPPSPQRAVRRTKCGRCHRQMEPGLAECPYCHAPVRVRDLQKAGNTLKGVAMFCIFTSVAMTHSQDWLRSKGMAPEMVTYLFWLLFIGGWIIAGIGGLLSGGTPVSTAEVPPACTDAAGPQEDKDE